MSEGWLVVTRKSDDSYVVAGFYATKAGALATVRGFSKWGMSATAIPAAAHPRTPGARVELEALS